MRKLFEMRKRGVSIIVGYVLLVIIAISLALLVYAWMKGYLPKEKTECPENVALIIEDFSCNNTEKNISIIFKNNGLFNISGAVVKISDKEGNLPINSLRGVYPLKSYKGHVFFAPDLKPNEDFVNVFSYSEYEKIVEIEIIPTREVEGERFLCENARIRQKIEEGLCVGGVISEPVCGNGQIEIGEECDDGNIIDGDGCDSNCQIEEGGCKNVGEDCSVSSNCCSGICFNGKCEEAVKTYYPEAGWREGSNINENNNNLIGWSDCDGVTNNGPGSVYNPGELSIISSDNDDSVVISTAQSNNKLRTCHRMRFSINENVDKIEKIDVLIKHLAREGIENVGTLNLNNLNLYLGNNISGMWQWELLQGEVNPIKGTKYTQTGSVTTSILNYIETSGENKFVYILLFSNGVHNPVPQPAVLLHDNYYTELKITRKGS